MQKIKWSVLSILLAQFTYSAQAQQLDVLKHPVSNAITYSKTIQNSKLENKKTDLDREGVKGKFLPKVTANGMYGYMNSTIDIDLPTQTLPITGITLFEGSQRSRLSSQVALAGVTATQVIFSGLQISNGQKALEQKSIAQNLLLEASYDAIAQEIVLSFDQLMLLKEVDLLISDSEKRLNKEHLKVTKAIANGLAIPYDRDKIKLAMLELESKRAEVASNRELLYYKLEELTGLPMEEVQGVSYQLQEIILNLDEASQMNRKELDALQASQKAYEYALKKEKGAQLPLLLAFGNVSYINLFDTRITIKDAPVVGDVKTRGNHFRMAPNYTVGLGMKWNIFEGKEHKVNIEKAKMDILINANKIEDTKEKLSLLQRKTLADYNLALKKTSVNKQQMTIAQNNLFLASRQFEEGLQDVTERLEAENEYYKQSLAYYNQILSQRTAATTLLKSNGNLYQFIIR
ncbi:TolC family protein [Sphingobacterium sp. Mn56C]|uniref:TolC family protein n=1 Tax=Sphingobacterium sp. Mn56C TaxID=3395261 RepID=UPI003BC0FD03